MSHHSPDNFIKYPDLAPNILQKTKSAPDILSRTPKTKVINLKTKTANLELINSLQIKVNKAKEKLALSRANLAQYSLGDNSASKAAAREEFSLIEKEVEEACKAWCYAKRS